ncbi:MAG: RHS repeat-associated core domain-containing protein, partial [Terriglobia bacterium]
MGSRTTAMSYGAADSTRQRFTSKERDTESGLDYFGARYYSAAQGRFTSPDPAIASIDVSNPQSLSRYTYCLNNPLAYVDPDGLEGLKVGTWDDLSEEQQRLFVTYVQNEYADEIYCDAVTFAANLWEASASAANGEAISIQETNRLLDQSQLTTFAAVTHMLESKGLIGEIASVTAINGEKQQSDFAIQGELKNAESAAKIEKVFKDTT